jgi:RimJ/RimL family protein N-acetyltransferase
MGLLQTDIELVRFGSDHITDIQRIASDRFTTDNTNTPYPYPEDGAAQFMSYCTANWNQGIARDYVIVLKGIVIGNCSVVHLKQEPLIGYMIAQEHWNKGFGRIVVGLLLRICKEDLGLSSIAAPVLKENIPSQRVLLANGFEFEREFTLPHDYPKFANRTMIQFSRKL